MPPSLVWALHGSVMAANIRPDMKSVLDVFILLDFIWAQRYGKISIIRNKRNLVFYFCWINDSYCFIVTVFYGCIVASY